MTRRYEVTALLPPPVPDHVWQTTPLQNAPLRQTKKASTELREDTAWSYHKGSLFELTDSWCRKFYKEKSQIEPYMYELANKYFLRMT